MKRMLTVALMLAFSSCTFLEESCSLGKTRSESYVGKQNIALQESLDTLVYVSAVDVPEGFDWQKDMAIGLGPGTLRFYKNHKIEKELKIGYEHCISSDADTHHIIDGHLITEFSQSDKTTIKKDGELFLVFDGREYLCGLCEKDDVIYSLSVDRNSGDLRYRQDGKLILSLPDAYAFGSFQESSYPETGALYISGGKVCFCYSIQIDKLTFYHLVKDGTDNQLVIGEDHYYYGVQDIRVIDGEIFMVSALSTMGFMFGTASSARFYGGDYNWSSLRIVPTEGRPAVFGSISSGGQTVGYGLVNSNGGVTTRACRNAVAFGYEIFDISHEDCVRFSNRTEVLLGDSFIEALTPRDINRKPFLLMGKDTVKYKVNGYISGLSACFSQSNSKSSTRQERL